MMIRLGTMLGFVLMGSLLAGCGGGITARPTRRNADVFGERSIQEHDENGRPENADEGEMEGEKERGTPTAESTDTNP